LKAALSHNKPLLWLFMCKNISKSEHRAVSLQHLSFLLWTIRRLIIIWDTTASWFGILCNEYLWILLTTASVSNRQCDGHCIQSSL